MFLRTPVIPKNLTVSKVVIYGLIIIVTPVASSEGQLIVAYNVLL